MVSYLDELVNAIKGTNWASIDRLMDQLKQTRAVGRTLFVCGNGGSHAVAIHWAVDLMKVANLEVHALGTNHALLTALANDIDYEAGLSTELSMRAHPGDILVALSCSGRSRNIVSTLGASKKLRMPTYMLTGLKAPEFAEVHTIRIQSMDYGILEDVFSAVGHYITREMS